MTGILGLGAAASLAAKEMSVRTDRIRKLKDILRNGLLDAVPGTAVNGSVESSLPGILSLSFPGVRAEQLLILMDLNGIAASSGSACTAGSVEPSHVLLAMGRTPAEARNAVRLSLSGMNTEDEARAAVRIIPELVRRLQR